MKSRIARTILAVVALVIVVLGVPLAIVIQRFYESRALLELQRGAAQAVAELTVPLTAESIANVADEPDVPGEFSVYDATGVRLYGAGPERLDTAEPDLLVVIAPVTDRNTETTVGSVRVSRARGDIAAQARRAWLLMALASAGAFALAYLIARREAARLAAPIAELAAAAERLGAGDFTVNVATTGTTELDTLAGTLNLSSQRLAELVAREREFSANASHQLRTPLTALRLSLDRGDLAAADEQAQRLESTVQHMLALARNALPNANLLALAPIIGESVGRWQPAYRRAARTLVATVPADLPRVRVRSGSIEQALDVLIDNALRHGAGSATITARAARGGVVIEITDEGRGIDLDRLATIFERQPGARLNIGLPLARTLIEADGGRLVVADPEHAEFHIVLPE